MIEITNLGQYYDEVVTEPDVVLLKFYLPTCGPCKVLDPILEQLEDTVKVFKVDSSQVQELSRKFKVKTVPTTVILKEGKEMDQVLGLRNADYFRNKINEVK